MSSQHPFFAESTQELVAFFHSHPQSQEIPWLILIGEAFADSLEAFHQALCALDLTFIGGVFPAVIYERYKSETGVVLIPLPVGTETHLVTNLVANPDPLPPKWHFSQQTREDVAAMIFVDGLTAHISDFLDALYNQLGNKIQYFGGGAGSLSLTQQPCIISPAGIFQDAAVVAMAPGNMELGVRHGWQKIMGPFVATKTEKNIISELNWEPAFEVYKEVLKKDSGVSIAHDNFFEHAKGYPFGLYREGEEDIVRDPITVNEKGELICVGEVPENSVLYILKGEAGSLIESAAQATRDCWKESYDMPNQVFIVDCISRTLFLEQEFEKELAAVTDVIAPITTHTTPMGVLTLGEISSYGEGYVEFFNKTIVLGMLYDERQS